MKVARRTAGRFAIASAIVTILAAVVLKIFFAVRGAPRGIGLGAAALGERSSVGKPPA